MNRAKILIGGVLAVAAAAGLYVADHYWIAPVATRRTQAAGNHPVAPPLSLTDLNGQKVSLVDYKGKVVLLDFWATWCGPCRIEIPGFVELQNRYAHEGLAVIGVSMDDSPEPVREFYQQFKMNYPVVMGNDNISSLYGGIIGLPTTFVIGRDGRIYSKHSGATDVAVFEHEIRELLDTKDASEVAGFEAAGRQEKVDLWTQEENNAEVPGVDVSHLGAAELTNFKKVLAKAQCDCGCKLNVLKCRHDDRSCAVSRKLAKDELEKFQKTRT